MKTIITDAWFTGLDQYHQLVLQLVPYNVKPFVRGDIKVSDDVFEIEEWLRINRHGKAILITMPQNKGAALPARCVRVRSPQQAVRHITGGK